MYQVSRPIAAKNYDPRRAWVLVGLAYYWVSCAPSYPCRHHGEAGAGTFGIWCAWI